jgi:hypothetical protein
MKNALGTALCVASFLVILYTAFQHGSLCSSMPAFDAAAGQTEPYFCKGYASDAFATPFQSWLRYWGSPLAAAGVLLGWWLRGRR